MPKKPEKYGVKFWVLREMNSKYVVNVIPYLGAQEKTAWADLSLAEDAISKILEPVTGKGYNITMDNFYVPQSSSQAERKKNYRSWHYSKE